MNKILSLIQTGSAEGAKLLHGGCRSTDKGYFVAPTVFADVTDDMTIANEEVRHKIMIRTIIFIFFYFCFILSMKQHFWKKSCVCAGR